MANVVIRVENLGKRYRIGQLEPYRMLRDALVNATSASFRAVSSALHGRQASARKTPQEAYVWALRNVSFEVEKGEVVGIIGSNGAGKTTLLKVLSRVTEPTEGQAQIGGRVGSLLEVGTGFHLELTGRENIYLSGTVLGMKKGEIDRKFDEIVAFAEVGRFIDTPVKRYSSGMHVRLGFAVAAHLEPEILLVDEVLAVGDASFQKKCLGKISDVSRAGRTVLFVSHNMTAITSLCQRAIWLDEGGVRKDDTARSCVSSYLATLHGRQTTTHGRVILDNHPGRLKRMDELIHILECQLLNDNGQPTSRFMSGHEARIHIGYRMQSRITTSAVTFVCAFRNDQSQRIAYCSSEVAGSDLSKLPVKGTMECLIPRLPLFPGSYSIDLGCRVGSNWTDFVYEAVRFEVLDGGFYPTGLLPPEEGGNHLLEYTWNTL